MYDLYFQEDMKAPLDEKEIKARLDSFLSELGVTSDFSISFVSDDEIRNLNREYRAKDEPTDVLTFRLKDDDTFPDVVEGDEMGDIFISLDAVSRNASEFSVPFSEELTRVMLHGLLHLLGYDHESNDFKSEKMLQKQEDIMLRLGYRS